MELEIALTAIVFVVAAVGVWLSRKRLILFVPLTVVFVVFLLFAAVALPSYVPARPSSLQMSCIANLMSIRNAKAEWASANNKVARDTPTLVDLYGTNGLSRHGFWCPYGGIYTIGSVGRNPTCSYRTHRLE